jgi:signal transduction histidine kinase
VTGEGALRAASDAALAAGLARPADGTAPAELAAVLGRVVAGLAETTGAERVAAWARDERGALQLVAARVEGALLPPPSEAAWSALAALAGPADLGASGAPALEALASEHGFAAAAPLRSAAGDLLAALLVGSRHERTGAVRPRVLAALAKAAAKCAGAVAAAEAAQRLARLDGAVQALDRLAAVGGLLAEIVHEIRNPLVSVKTFLHLLGEEDAAGSAEFRAVAIDEVRRIERLLEVVMQHARPPSAPSAEAIGEIEPALRSVAQLATLRASARSVKLEVALAPDVKPAAIAPDALRQVLLNLALNAVEVSGRGATVRLSAEPAAGGVLVAVEDEGPGVPEALRQRVFEPFFSTKPRAGGLGLAITRRLVEQAGGAIEIHARAPHGSRFCVTLPLAKA